MNENNLVSIQQYAVKHKRSTFAVIKQINAGHVKTVKKDDQDYILDESISQTQPSASLPQPVKKVEEEGKTDVDYEAKFHELLSKYIDLQEKYTRLIEEKYDTKK
ncbi:hypothetical protein [Sulfurospirillum cavolei]|uniref:hypothetical protein n=1 Tax=Sulfurospirillum cavolei TaxID=366522 RepID=UPI000764B5F4|nr:hypothetical protein [Sulfurospirillum cavolei]